MGQVNFIASMFFRVIVGFTLFSILLFLPAGTFDWPEAWTFIIILLTYAIALHFLIFKENPTALKLAGRTTGYLIFFISLLFFECHTLTGLPFLTRAAIISANPRKLTTEGPQEKSNRYENANPKITATIPTPHAIKSLFLHVSANIAENVDGMIRKEKITRTPAILTENVMTKPIET